MASDLDRSLVRTLSLIIALTVLWALAPILDETYIMDSPSLLLMPIIAAVSVVAARDWRWALTAPAIALVPVLIGYSAWTIAIQRYGITDAVGFSVGIIPFHLIGTWLLIGIFWWPGRKLRAFSQRRPAVLDS